MERDMSRYKELGKTVEAPIETLRKNIQKIKEEAANNSTMVSADYLLGLFDTLDLVSKMIDPKEVPDIVDEDDLTGRQ